MRAIAHAFTCVLNLERLKSCLISLVLLEEYVWLEKSCIVNIKYFSNNAIDAVMVQIRFFLTTGILLNLYRKKNEHVKLVSLAEVRPRCISCWELVIVCFICFDVSIAMELWLKCSIELYRKYVLNADLGRLKIIS